MKKHGQQQPKTLYEWADLIMSRQNKNGLVTATAYYSYGLQLMKGRIFFIISSKGRF